MKKEFSISVRAFLVSLLLATASLVGQAQKHVSTRLPFSPGEELFYQAEFKKALLRGANIGEFRFSVRSAPSEANGNDPLRLVGDVVSKGFFAKLAGVHFHEHVESIV